MLHVALQERRSLLVVNQDGQRVGQRGHRQSVQIGLELAQVEIRASAGRAVVQLGQAFEQVDLQGIAQFPKASEQRAQTLDQPDRHLEFAPVRQHGEGDSRQSLADDIRLERPVDGIELLGNDIVASVLHSPPGLGHPSQIPTSLSSSPARLPIPSSRHCAPPARLSIPSDWGGQSLAFGQHQSLPVEQQGGHSARQHHQRQEHRHHQEGSRVAEEAGKIERGPGGDEEEWYPKPVSQPLPDESARACAGNEARPPGRSRRTRTRPAPGLYENTSTERSTRPRRSPSNGPVAAPSSPLCARPERPADPPEFVSRETPFARWTATSRKDNDLAVLAHVLR